MELMMADMHVTVCTQIWSINDYGEKTIKRLSARWTHQVIGPNLGEAAEDEGKAHETTKDGQ
jgi:hypothetical protein